MITIIHAIVKNNELGASTPLTFASFRFLDTSANCIPDINTQKMNPNSTKDGLKPARLAIDVNGIK